MCFWGVLRRTRKMSKSERKRAFCAFFRVFAKTPQKHITLREKWSRIREKHRPARTPRGEIRFSRISTTFLASNYVFGGVWRGLKNRTRVDMRIFRISTLCDFSISPKTPPKTYRLARKVIFAARKVLFRNLFAKKWLFEFVKITFLASRYVFEGFLAEDSKSAKSEAFCSFLNFGQKPLKNASTCEKTVKEPLKSIAERGLRALRYAFERFLTVFSQVDVFLRRFWSRMQKSPKREVLTL